MIAILLALSLQVPTPAPRTRDIYALMQYAEDGLLANCDTSAETEMACVYGKNLIFASRIQIARNQGHDDTVVTTFNAVRKVLTDGVTQYPVTRPYFQWLIEILTQS